MTEPLPPPNDVVAEASVVSALLLDPERIAAVESLVQPGDFYDARHRRIAEAIWDLDRECAAIDVTSVASRLHGTGRLLEAGGTPYLAQVFDSTPAVAHVEDHARVVGAAARIRRVMNVCRTVAAEGYGSLGDAAAWLQTVEARVLAATDVSTMSKETIAILGDATAVEFEELRDRCNGKREIAGRPTRIAGIDRILHGLIDGVVYVLAARPGHGKAQPVDAQVLTPRGFVAIGTIRPGDEVVGLNGQPTRVLGIYPQGEKQVHRVTMSDGSSTECCDEHLWFTQTRNERRSGIVGKARQLCEIRETLKIEQGARANHSVPLVHPVEFRCDSELPIHPYVLGLLLGDGDWGGGNVRFHKPEPDLHQKIALLLPVTDSVTPIEGGIRIVRSQRASARSATRVALSALGLDGVDSLTKLIPASYLMASVADRRELLRGLLDSDGHVQASGSSVDYSSSSPRLARDVRFLVRSLGGIVVQSDRIPRFDYLGEKRDGARNYRMTIRFPDATVPVGSAKNLARWRALRGNSKGYYIDRIETSRRAECVCIKVAASDQLYVTDDFIVTHNTALAWQIAQGVATSGDSVVFLSQEMPRAQLVQRAIAQAASIEPDRIRKATLDAGEWSRVATSVGFLETLPIAIDDRAGHTVHSARSAVRRCTQKLHAKGHAGKLGLVVLDYLQIMGGERRGDDSRSTEVSENMHGMTRLAKEFGCPVLILSQLNRGIDKRTEKRPQLSDLNESGAIEADAYSVIFIYREDCYRDEDQHDGLAEVIVSKHRNGRTGSVKLRYMSSTLFAGVADEFDEAGQEMLGGDDWRNQ